MNLRFRALETTTERHYEKEGSPHNTHHDGAAPVSSESFGKYVFTRAIMQKMLPREIYKNLVDASEGKTKIQSEYANTIAVAMKEWAVSMGATHFTHMFQPLTGVTAEKHDAFIEWNTPDQVIEKFSGEQLLQGEPDASSFPSGGLRSTYEARGYTGWDPASPAFIWKTGDSVTLCIPSVFFSWTGHVLDSKIPLIRSDKKLSRVVMRLLRLTGMEAQQVCSSLGTEQEYFVIDRALRDRRPDLLLAGRTVFGAPSPKGQELQDHYFGSVKDRVLDFMQDFETAALYLGIPVKTRHNEVAPSQHEVAPVYEKSAIAVDHNILLMELMRKTALKHNLACLLHEKPFHALNGSGKHSNWSLITDQGVNLLDPSGEAGKNITFLVILTAIVRAIHDHAGLLRASIGSASNDHRLGGHEAPPAIISVYLGSRLEEILNEIEETGCCASKEAKDHFDLGILELPSLSKDNTDRNRTSPFAFTGNKFEFRAVGSSQNPAFSTTVLNAIVAQSLERILDEAEHNLKGKTEQDVVDALMPVLRENLKASRSIRFSGDNYSGGWLEEAKKRRLPIYKKCIDSFDEIPTLKTVAAFEGILTDSELQSRYEILCEQYIENINIETKLMLDIFRTQILPPSIRYQKELAESLVAYGQVSGTQGALTHQSHHLASVAETIENAIAAANALEQAWKRCAHTESLTEKGKTYAHEVLKQSDALRAVVDHLETLVDDALWPLPKYRELLFMT